MSEVKVNVANEEKGQNWFVELCENMIRKNVDVVDETGDKNYSVSFDYDTIGRALYTNQIEV